MSEATENPLVNRVAAESSICGGESQLLTFFSFLGFKDAKTLLSANFQISAFRLRALAFPLRRRAKRAEERSEELELHGGGSASIEGAEGPTER